MMLSKAKRIIDGMWVKGSALEFDGGNVYICENKAKPELLKQHYLRHEKRWTIREECLHHVDPATLCRYTGLKDKNDKEVFLNDIVKRDDDGPYYLVQWNDVEAGFYLNCLDKKYPNQGMSFIRVCEIIGNIHDNPELLKASS